MLVGLVGGCVKTGVVEGRGIKEIEEVEEVRRGRRGLKRLKS